MKSIFISLLISVSFVTIGKSQNAISCDKLIEVISDRCSWTGGISSSDLVVERSNWLNKIDAYECDDVIFVIADIKVDTSIVSRILNETKSYIYCGIPKENWKLFSEYSYENVRLTTGEKFHKYIIDYKCNCY